MSALYPNVPNLPGVPAVLRRAGQYLEDQLTFLGATVETSPAVDQWGIFDQGGERVLEPDSIVSLEYGGEYRIADYPTEAGGFQSYNKVAVPFEMRIAMSKGGSVAERTQFINDLEALHSSLDRYDISTPEHVYTGVNITRVVQMRSAESGAAMANVEIVVQEVRETVFIAYSATQRSEEPPPLAAAPEATEKKPLPTFRPKTTKAPSAVRAVNRGAVQARPVTISGARLETTPSGRQLYVYDKPIGRAK